MRISPLLLAALVNFAPASPSLAADFDGSKPFLCSSIDVASCGPGDACARSSAGAANAPQFFLIDVEKRSVVDTSVGGGTRMSKIEHTERLPGLLVLGGSDGALAWIATVNESTGRVTLAATGDRVGFMIFGACILR
ncbi:MAG TPA: hypothetical protein VMU06_11460 [Stellaceae bacterium]|nr:hypothetical protein [Stellaceae bacterium]